MIEVYEKGESVGENIFRSDQDSFISIVAFHEKMTMLMKEIYFWLKERE